MRKNYFFTTIFSLTAFLFFAIPLSVFAATQLSVSPASSTFTVGDQVTLHVLVSSDVTLNAISGDVVLPSSLFSIIGVSKESSILNFWVTEPTFSNTSGVVHFEGVALRGFSGNSGTVLTIIARALKAGTGKISFQAGQVLADDGQGTDITGSLNGANMTIVDTTVKPEPAPTPTPAPVPVPTQIVTPATLTAPSISIGSKYGAEAINGSSGYANAQVLLTFMSDDGNKIFITGSTDGDGSFILLVPHSLKHGVYTVTSVIIKTDGSKSDSSNELSIPVGNIFSDINWQTWVFIVLLILAILYLLIRAYMHMRKTKHFRHEKHEAEQILHKSFDILREDIEGQSFGKSSVMEQKQIKKDIEDAEKIIDKEIKDIDV